MIDLIRNFFGKTSGADSLELVQDVNHDLPVACLALFLEMANIDGEFSDVERESIISFMKGRYDLSKEIVQELMDSAKKELEQSIDLWQFTNLINHNYTLDEKLGIIEMFWRVAYADGKLESHEDYLLHKLANLLRLSHRQLIDAKMKVLKREPA